MQGRLATPVSWQCDRNPLMNTDLVVGAAVKFNWAQTVEFTRRGPPILGGVAVQPERPCLSWSMLLFARQVFSGQQRETFAGPEKHPAPALQNEGASQLTVR